MQSEPALVAPSVPHTGSPRDLLHVALGLRPGADEEDLAKLPHGRLDLEQRTVVGIF